MASRTTPISTPPNSEQESAQVNAPLPGVDVITYFRYYDYFSFRQDEWRVRHNLTFRYGIRYETPGNPFANLAASNERVVAAFKGDERYRYTPVPGRDTNNWALSVGYVGKGTRRSNPSTPISRSGVGEARCASIRAKASFGSAAIAPRQAIIRLQTSLEKRLSNNFSMAAHYTWSAFIDGASEVFNPSVSGEIAFPQDPTNRRADRGRHL